MAASGIQNSVLRLFDPETETTYELVLSTEDCKRALADPKYAQALLFHAKANRNVVIEGASSSAHNIENVCENGAQNEEEAEAIDGTSAGVEKHAWSYDESMALIRSMATHMEDLNHPKKKKHVFMNVANDVVSQGFTVTATMCAVKWKNLLRSYKTAKDNKGKTGRGPTRFMFFEAMDELLGEKPANKCSHTLESSNMQNLNDDLDDDTGLPEGPQATNQVSNMEKKAPFKRRNGKENFILMKKEEYAKRQKRHDERVALTKRKLNQEDRKITLLEKLVGSNET